MPDLSLLVEIADFYGVDIREIINGERKSGKMDEELKDTLRQVADYGEEEKKRLKRKMSDMSAGAAVMLVFALLLRETGGFGAIPEQACRNAEGFALGLVLAALVLNVLWYSGVLDKIRTWKLNRAAKKKA